MKHPRAFMALILAAALVVEPATAAAPSTENRAPRQAVTQYSVLSARCSFDNQAITAFLTSFNKPPLYRRLQSRAGSVRLWLPQVEKSWGVTLHPSGRRHAGDVGVLGHTPATRYFPLLPTKISWHRPMQMEDASHFIEGGRMSQPPIHAAGFAAREFLDVLGLGTFEAVRALSAKPDGRPVPGTDVTAYTIEVPTQREVYPDTGLPKGLSMLPTELGDTRRFDVLYRQGRLIGIFPLKPHGDRHNYFDVSGLQFDPPQPGAENAEKTWTEFALRWEEDQAAMRTYQRSTGTSAQTLGGSIFVHARVDEKTGDALTMPFNPRNVLTSPDILRLITTRRTGTHQATVQVMPTVYEPDQDPTYLQEIYQAAQQMNTEVPPGGWDSLNTYIKGTGTGMTGWVISRVTRQRRMYAYDLNPFARANTRVLGHFSGVEFETDPERFPSKFRIVEWNMPRFEPNLSPQAINHYSTSLWDPDAGGVQLSAFAPEAAAKLDGPEARVMTWNVGWWNPAPTIDQVEQSFNHSGLVMTGEPVSPEKRPSPDGHRFYFLRQLNPPTRDQAKTMLRTRWIEAGQHTILPGRGYAGVEFSELVAMAQKCLDHDFMAAVDRLDVLQALRQNPRNHDKLIGFVLEGRPELAEQAAAMGANIINGTGITKDMMDRIRAMHPHVLFIEDISRVDETPEQMESHIKEANEAGVDGVLLKPFFKKDSDWQTRFAEGSLSVEGIRAAHPDWIIIPAGGVFQHRAAAVMSWPIGLTPAVGFDPATPFDEQLAEYDFTRADGKTRGSQKPEEVTLPSWALLSAEEQAKVLGQAIQRQYDSDPSRTVALLEPLKSGKPLRVAFIPGKHVTEEEVSTVGRGFRATRENPIIKTILLDMGNVMVPIDPLRIVEQLVARAGLSDQRKHEFFDEASYHWKLDQVNHFMTGQLSTEEFYRRVKDALRLREDLTLNEFKEIWGQIIAVKSDLQVIDAHVIEHLKQMGHKVYGFSNTDPVHMEVFSAHPDYGAALKVLDGFLASYDLGGIKPNPDVYVTAMDRLRREHGLSDIRPGEILFVDDNKLNLETARQQGWNTFLFRGLQEFLQWWDSASNLPRAAPSHQEPISHRSP